LAQDAASTNFLPQEYPVTLSTIKQ
jgi:hypothetical protein